MTENFQKRINSMFSGDCLWAILFVAGLWLAYAFVFTSINSINTDGTIKVVLMIGGSFVVLYNTASITAMLSHYKEDKNAIYGIDIKHLDEMKKEKSRLSS